MAKFCDTEFLAHEAWGRYGRSRGSTVNNMRCVPLTAVAAVLLLVGCGTTEPHHGRWNPNVPARNEDWHSPRASLLRYDTNHDGILTRAELAAGLKAEFGSYDTDKNNCLSPDEVRTINQARVQQDASQAVPLVDWNQDGCVDFKEFSGAALSLFDSLDANGDGQLTAAELNPAGQHPPREQPGAGRPGHGADREPGRG